MAMQKQLWSVSGLAVELGVDRRTLSKRLQGLTPAEEKKHGRRTERRYALSDVVEHLQAPRGLSHVAAYLSREAALETAVDAGVDATKLFVGTEMLPKLLDNPQFVGIFTGGLREELGLTKAQCLRAYQIVGCALVYGIADGFGDDDMGFAENEMARALSDLGIDGYIAANWPDEA